MSGRLRSSTRASTAASESLAETELKIKAKGDSRKSYSVRSTKSADAVMKFRIRFAMFAFVLSLVALGALYYVVMNDILRLYPSSMKVESLKGFNTRAEFSLRYQVLLYAWLVFMVNAVIYARITRRALDPSVEGTERQVQPYKNMLTNSFEQTIISSFLQLAFVSFADHSYTLKLIPAINIVQFVGRIAFFIGYPYYRTLGVSFTSTPNLLMCVFNLYKLGSYLNMY